MWRNPGCVAVLVKKLIPRVKTDYCNDNSDKHDNNDGNNDIDGNDAINKENPTFEDKCLFFWSLFSHQGHNILSKD